MFLLIRGDNNRLGEFVTDNVFVQSLKEIYGQAKIWETFILIWRFRVSDPH